MKLGGFESHEARALTVIGCHYREDTVILATRPSQHPFSHFILKHEQGFLYARGFGHEFKNNRAADVVGQVADHLEFFIETVVKGGQIQVQHVHALYAEVVAGCPGQKFLAEKYCQAAVDLHCNDPGTAPAQRQGQGAESGADFQYHIVGARSYGCSDFLSGGLVDEKMLPQTFDRLLSQYLQQPVGGEHALFLKVVALLESLMLVSGKR
jgi:hypothetical protein